MAIQKSNPLAFKTNGFDIFNNILMFVIAVCTIFPLYYVVIISLATQADIHKHLMYVLPYSFSIESYKYILQDNLIPNSFLVSVFVTVAGTFGAMVVSTAAGYALSKKDTPGSKIMFAYIIVTMFIGGGMIPYYLTIKNLGLMDNILVLIVPGMCGVFNLILIKNFFEEIPASVEESARIDGANDIVVLFKIVLPMSAPIIATISLFYAVGYWNDYFSALMYIVNNMLKPLQLVLREILIDFSTVTASSAGAAIAQANSPVYTLSLQMAVIVIATVPIFIAYPFVQKYFAAGINLGAVKE